MSINCHISGFVSLYWVTLKLHYWIDIGRIKFSFSFFIDIAYSFKFLFINACKIDYCFNIGFILYTYLIDCWTVCLWWQIPLPLSCEMRFYCILLWHRTWSATRKWSTCQMYVLPYTVLSLLSIHIQRIKNKVQSVFAL